MTTHWYASRTIWLAIIQAVVGILVVAMTQYPGLGGLMIAKSVVDAILRVMTTDPIQ
jgi:hypothetical protein